MINELQPKRGSLPANSMNGAWTTPQPLNPQIWFDLNSVNLPRAAQHYAEEHGKAKAARYFRELAAQIEGV